MDSSFLRCVAELVHGIVFTTGLERGFASEIFLMLVTNVGTRHVLVLHTGDTLADFLALDAGNIAKHTHFAEIILRQIVRAQCGGVICWQGNKVVENARALRRIALEILDPHIGLAAQFGLVI